MNEITVTNELEIRVERVFDASRARTRLLRLDGSAGDPRVVGRRRVLSYQRGPANAHLPARSL